MRLEPVFSQRQPRTRSFAMALVALFALLLLSGSIVSSKRLLTPEQHDPTRQKGSETPFSSLLNDIHEQGIFDSLRVPVAAAAQTELVTNGSFGGSPNSAGWVLSGSFFADSRFSNCHSCPGYAYVSNSDGTGGNSLVGILYQNFGVLSNATSGTVTFWHYITTQETGSNPFDVLNVTIRNTSNTVLATVAVLSNVNKSTGYVQKSFPIDLTPYRGQILRIHFLATTDSSLPTVFRVDDVSVSTDTTTATIPGAPNLAASPGNGQNFLAWNPPASNGGATITSYRVFRGTTSSNQQLVTSGGCANLGAVLACTDTNLTNGQNYYYTVRAVNSVDQGLPSNQVTATPTAPVAAPSGLISTSSSPTTATLTWADNSNNETGFKVERKTGTGGTYAQIGTQGQNLNFFNDSGLTGGTQYCYRVRATNGSSDSNYSNEQCVTTQGSATIPGAPNLAAVPGNSQNVLSWNAPSNGGATITSYRVSRGTTSSNRQLITSGGCGNLGAVLGCTDAGLTNGQSYNYIVNAVNSVGQGAPSDPVTATPIAPIPALSITTTSLNPATATVGMGYAAQQAVAATGGQTPYSWSASGLPNGMGINSSSGVVSGTPTVAGTFNFTVTVRDSSSPQQTASKGLVITVTDITPMPSVTPLIFIPGISGSSLRRLDGDQEELWPGLSINLVAQDARHKALNLSQTRDLDPSSVVREVDLSNLPFTQRQIYKPLLDTLSGAGYVEGGPHPTLFPFPYDWRKSNAEAAKELKRLVLQIRQVYPNSKVNIVAHSMGGVVARRYIIDMVTASDQHHVDKLITIGTPWLGAPKVINTLESGEFFDGIAGLLIRKSTLKQVIETFPGAHELIPSRAYFELGGRPFAESGWDINRDGTGGLFSSQVYNYSQLYILLDAIRFPTSQPANNGLLFHRVDGQDNWRDKGYGVQYYHIYGEKPRADTIGQVIATIGVKCRSIGIARICFPAQIIDVKETRGDGTVPLISATRCIQDENGLCKPEPQSNYNEQSARVVRFSSGDGDVEHTGLTKNSNVHAYIISALSSTQPLMQQFAQTSEPLTQQAYYLKVLGAVSATLIDNAGNSLNPLSDLPGAGVPDVTSYSLAADSFLTITPTDQTYTLTFTTGSEPVVIDLKKGTDESTAQAIRYLDLDLPPNTAARILITPEGVGALQYDGNGDGAFETTVTPTVSVSGSAAQDTEPPTVSVSETRQQTGTLVTLSATDSSSGVKALHYSLDGTNYQPYTTPFNVDPYRNPVIYAFADDNVANRSSLVTYNLTAPASALQLNQTTNSVGEAGGHVDIVVNRSGDTSAAATINYATSDTLPIQNNCQDVLGIASSRCDYATTIGTLRFAAGETSKTIFIPIIDDNIADGNETFTVTLSNPNGASLGTTTTATITITDNPNTAGNPIDQAAFFIREHYIDFLGREPEPQGLTDWLNIYNNCGVTIAQPCDRIEISSAFFRSEEFQNRAYFIYRLYSAVGKIPLYEGFMPDFAKVSGFLSTQELEANKVAFIEEFMARQDYQSKYGSITDPTTYVNALLQTVGLPNHPGKATWITALTNQTMTKAQVLRALTESSEVYQKYFNEAFVIMQYFGYLRRSADISYLNWIQTMNSSGGDYRTMINGFLNSAEYRNRFGN